MQILNMIKNVGIFMICAQTIIHFKPAGNYEKYFRLLTNIMVLAMICIPSISFFRKEGYAVYQETLREYERMIQEEMPKIQMEDSWGEERILQLTRQELQNTFNEIAGAYGYRVLYIEWEHADMTGKVQVAVENTKDVPKEGADGIVDIEPVAPVRIMKEEERKAEEKEEELRVLSNAFALLLEVEQTDVEVIESG